MVVVNSRVVVPVLVDDSVQHPDGAGGVAVGITPAQSGCVTWQGGIATVKVIHQPSQAEVGVCHLGPFRVQVLSPTQLVHSVNFLQSRINVKSVSSINAHSSFAFFVLDSNLGPQGTTQHTVS